MEMRKVKSSSIAAHGYDPLTKTLAVEFTSGQAYEYKDVPPDVAGGLLSAPSVGSYFQQKVRGQFEHTRREPESNAGE